MNNSANYVIIIGAGPAGLAAAIAAASNGHKVLVLEHLPSAGRKLLASGAGKCNITNILNADEMAERFAPEQSRFVRRVLLSFPNEKLLDFFREIPGVLKDALLFALMIVAIVIVSSFCIEYYFAPNRSMISYFVGALLILLFCCIL